MRNSVLYPDKLNDLEGRIVTVAAIDYKPYAFVERRVNTKALLQAEALKNKGMEYGS